MEFQLKRRVYDTSLGVAFLICSSVAFGDAPPTLAPGARVLLDAHNCYPYQGQWADRIERALATGMPLAMEPDLDWVDGKSIVSHGKPYTGEEPTLDEYFLARIAPTLREALNGPRDQWPLVTLNVDFKNSSREHCSVIRDVLMKYEDILTTAVKTDDIQTISPYDVRPLLVLASGSGGQFQVFYEDVPVGRKLLVFGAAETSLNVPDGLSRDERSQFVATLAAQEILPRPADNFRRWWNNPWSLVEAGGQPRAGEWTSADAARLHELVQYGHDRGYLVRFYTLNGHPSGEGSGWSTGYNFGSVEAVTLRWRAAVEAGTDYVATDMYEAFAEVLQSANNDRRNRP